MNIVISNTNSFNSFATGIRIRWIFANIMRLVSNGLMDSDNIRIGISNIICVDSGLSILIL